MCTARTKLKEVENEMDCLYADLRDTRNELLKSMNETWAAEAEAKRYADRCMRLTKNADIANLRMIVTSIGFVISVGFLVY